MEEVGPGSGALNTTAPFPQHHRPTLTSHTSHYFREMRSGAGKLGRNALDSMFAFQTAAELSYGQDSLRRSLTSTHWLTLIKE